MSGDNKNPSSSQVAGGGGTNNQNKVYGSYKVSEFSHGKEGYRIEESPEIAERK